MRDPAHRLKSGEAYGGDMGDRAEAMVGFGDGCCIPCPYGPENLWPCLTMGEEVAEPTVDRSSCENKVLVVMWVNVGVSVITVYGTREEMKSAEKYRSGAIKISRAGEGEWWRGGQVV